jgi:hypothetical protein
MSPQKTLRDNAEQQSSFLRPHFTHLEPIGRFHPFSYTYLPTKWGVLMSDYTLFIPDISGFTRFVKSTEISHSKHIIEELITLIIDSVGDSFEVAEIEGDAVFFYSDKEYTAQELIDLSKQIYVAFHMHLLHYQNNRICNCGACTSAVALKLKFVVHRGEVSLAQFGKRAAKPFGDSVIAIHRLLKNDVPSDEYVLLSDQIPTDPAIELNGEGVKSDDDLGELHYRFLLAAPWRTTLHLDAKAAVNNTTDLEVRASRSVPIAAQLVHHFITDFRYRKLWNTDATEIVYDDDSIN